MISDNARDKSRLVAQNTETNNINASCCGILLTVVLEDLKDKVSLINTIIPIAYWISRIGSNNFVINFNFIFLSIGIFFAAIQIHYQDIFESFFGKYTKDINDLINQTFYLKQNKIVVIFVLLFWIYGLTTFSYMWTGLKDGIVWTLIAFYLIGVLVYVIKIVGMVRQNPGYLTRIGNLFLKK